MSDENKEPQKLPETIKIEIDVKKYINIFLNKLKQIYKLTLKLCIIFIVINFLIFIPLISKALQSSEYPKQKVLLSCASKITKLYILPLSKKFGYKSKITKPFYYLRDKLYYKGISMLPENSPEREVWWYNTRFVEYAGIVVPRINELLIFERELQLMKILKILIIGLMKFIII